ncbi:RNA polymerase sigma factor SigJ [Sandaracinus amylolyticus]|uniref:RNA polymerase sigma-70 factor n=1 Tax=Sandaracinus amylolyticus TaxID=927083 RepID=A0A0F6YIC6_9BACT|nr:RNA polymerase sigma factor SigJ [Sandaracinus amylolyticus]AKF04957.1 RNA polymerase sigma-70 factor [Sandaracinus amylolyticus]
MTDVLEPHRRRLWGIAYRMLGSIADADDMVQETFLRWHRRDDDELVRTPEAWLVTTITRLCIDRLRARRTERSTEIDPWLPTPIVTDSPERAVELASDLSVAFLLLLERLAPEERAAFLLRDVFDVDYPAIARALGRSEAACRQVVHRARERVRTERSRSVASPEARAEIAHRFAAALRAKDDRALVELLTEDARLATDGRGVRGAARRWIVGRDRVARALAGIARKRERAGAVEERVVFVGGEPGVVTYVDGVVVSISALELEGTRVRAVHRVLDPDKLRAAMGARE